MPAAAMELLHQDGQVKAALAPIRRQLLELLCEPASATELARQTGLSRQKLNYHLRVLERAGLVELVETRQRRGCVERVLRASADQLVVDPGILAPGERLRSRDRYAAEHLVDAASDVVRTVSRLRAGAESAQKRLLTFTVEAEVTFGQPADVHAFADALAASVAELAERFGSDQGQRFSLLIGGHPATREDHDHD
ncbi:MAG: winged helix-turn-helix domain-containing protein [Micropruina sp.]|uniref:ArsR/SmtB family transcription factor n=1 Tax=Micropruina sp. TaxID=2737536 RepID=UPI0039E55F2A